MLRPDQRHEHEQHEEEGGAEQREPPRSLARIASGGELSRVALAIRQILAEADATPTLVFDEIDTGIGGRSAEPVGRSLWVLARRHQVLCVTHLPQIAAFADAHFRIRKEERAGRTVTDVSMLDREGRILELAEMIGGAAATAAPLSPSKSQWVQVVVLLPTAFMPL